MTGVEPAPPPQSAPAQRRPRLSSQRGQASVDYAALLAVVVVAFAGAGAAAGSSLSRLPAAVAGVVRTGICIVGGDVCRAADARADGLLPCVVDERARGAGLTVAIVSLRVGEKGEWTVARRSDGTVLITHANDRIAGVGGGVGFELGRLEVGAQGSLDAALASGAAWELPSTAAAARFLADVRARRARPAPTWRFGDLGEEASGWLGLDAFGATLTGAELSAKAAAGVRTGRGTRTVYIDAGTALSGPAELLPDSGPPTGRGTSQAPGGGRTGPLLLAVTRDRGGLRELAFRRVAAGEGDAEVVETVGRLDLRDPTSRAVAERLLRVRLPWPPAIADDLRAVLRRTLAAGTIERAVYSVEDRSHEFSFAARLALELGVEASSLDVSRRLVDASAWTHGSPERRRVDCVGEHGRRPEAALG